MNKEMNIFIYFFCFFSIYLNFIITTLIIINNSI